VDQMTEGAICGPDEVRRGDFCLMSMVCCCLQHVYFTPLSPFSWRSAVFGSSVYNCKSC